MSNTTFLRYTTKWSIIPEFWLIDYFFRFVRAAQLRPKSICPVCLWFSNWRSTRKLDLVCESYRRGIRTCSSSPACLGWWPADEKKEKQQKENRSFNRNIGKIYSNMRRILDATDPFQIQGIIIDASLEFAQMIFALQTHSNINYWHWWIKFFQAWFHNNTLLNIPSGALHVDAMHTAAVPRCCAVITKRKQNLIQ